jgi:phosphoserine aminotransferase
MNIKIFFSVGPTEIFPEVKEFYSAGFKKKLFSVHHRSKEFEEIHSNTVANLKKLLNIPEHEIFFFSSATECMERVILNLVDQSSFHYINGYFAQRFSNIAKQYGKPPIELICESGKSFFTEEEDKIIDKEAEVICFTYNETSTGTALPIREIVNIKKLYPDKIIVLDAVSATPFYEIDFGYVDCAFFSVQKGFGMPPGLGVLIVNAQCLKKADILSQITGQEIFSFNFNKYSENFNKNQTSYTPNIPAIYVLGKVCEMMLKKGLDIIRKETEEKYALLDNFISESKVFTHFVKRPEDRSKTTIAVNTKYKSSEVINKLNNSGFVVSSGYGEYKNSQIRIGNFPVHKIQDFKNLINELNKI